MQLIVKLKQTIYKYYSFLFKSTYCIEHMHMSITQEEANALYELIDSYANDVKTLDR